MNPINWNSIKSLRALKSLCDKRESELRKKDLERLRVKQVKVYKLRKAGKTVDLILKEVPQPSVGSVTLHLQLEAGVTLRYERVYLKPDTKQVSFRLV